MYSILTAPGAEERKAKRIRHSQYKDVLFLGRLFHHGMDMLPSQGQQIYGLHMNKVSLSPLDMKWWIAADGHGISTLAYGHREAG